MALSAKQEIDQRKRTNEKAAKQRMEEVFRKSPEYESLHFKRNEMYSHAVKLIMTGNSEDGRALQRQADALEDKQKQVLEMLGYPSDYLEVKYTCPICHDTGWVNKTYQCECLKKLIATKSIEKYNYSNFEEEASFEAASFSCYDDQEDETYHRNTRAHYQQLFKKMQQFCVERKNALSDPSIGPQNFILSGRPGTSKSYLSSCVAKCLEQLDVPVIYISAPRLVEALYEDVKIGTNNLEQFKHVEVFILDDLGTENTTEYTKKTITELCSERLLNKKSTIISTNLNFNELYDIYPERFSSRLFGNYHAVRCFGKDLRHQQMLKKGRTTDGDRANQKD